MITPIGILLSSIIVGFFLYKKKKRKKEVINPTIKPEELIEVKDPFKNLFYIPFWHQFINNKPNQRKIRKLQRQSPHLYYNSN